MATNNAPENDVTNIDAEGTAPPRTPPWALKRRPGVEADPYGFHAAGLIVERRDSIPNRAGGGLASVLEDDDVADEHLYTAPQENLDGEIKYGETLEGIYDDYDRSEGEETPSPTEAEDAYEQSVTVERVIERARGLSVVEEADESEMIKGDQDQNAREPDVWIHGAATPLDNTHDVAAPASNNPPEVVIPIRERIRLRQEALRIANSEGSSDSAHGPKPAQSTAAVPVPWQPIPGESTVVKAPYFYAPPVSAVGSGDSAQASPSATIVEREDTADIVLDNQPRGGFWFPIDAVARRLGLRPRATTLASPDVDALEDIPAEQPGTEPRGTRTDSAEHHPENAPAKPVSPRTVHLRPRRTQAAETLEADAKPMRPTTPTISTKSLRVRREALRSHPYFGTAISLLAIIPILLGLYWLWTKSPQLQNNVTSKVDTITTQFQERLQAPLESLFGKTRYTLSLKSRMAAHSLLQDRAIATYTVAESSLQRAMDDALLQAKQLSSDFLNVPILYQLLAMPLYVDTAVKESKYIYLAHAATTTPGPGPGRGGAFSHDEKAEGTKLQEVLAELDHSLGAMHASLSSVQDEAAFKLAVHLTSPAGRSSAASDVVAQVNYFQLMKKRLGAASQVHVFHMHARLAAFEDAVKAVLTGDDILWKQAQNIRDEIGRLEREREAAWARGNLKEEEEEEEEEDISLLA